MRQEAEGRHEARGRSRKRTGRRQAEEVGGRQRQKASVGRGSRYDQAGHSRWQEQRVPRRQKQALAQGLGGGRRAQWLRQAAGEGSRQEAGAGTSQEAGAGTRKVQA